MVKRKTLLQKILTYWPLLMTAASLLVALVTSFLSLQAQRDTAQAEAQRDALLRKIDQQCARIDTLERILVQEYPVYSPSLYYLHAPTC